MKQSKFSKYLKEIVYGGNDGIVTTFAVVAGFSGASLSNGQTLQLSFLAVLLFGLANLFADGLSMGLGNFLAVRSEKDIYNSQKEKELKKISKKPKEQERKTRKILIDKGFTKEQIKQLLKIYKQNKQFWVDFIMSYKVKIPNPENTNPVFTGAATFSSFVFFGFIPLIPFTYSQLTPKEAFIFSSISTFLALLILGSLKARVIKKNTLKSIVEIILVGGIAASAAYLVGTLFH